MNELIFLVLFPLCIAGLALVVPPLLNLRRTIGVTANIVLCAVPIYLLVTYLDAGPVFFHLESKLVNTAMLVVEVLIALYIVYLSVRAKRYLPVLLVVVQSLIMLSFELTSGHGMHIEHSLFVDKFALPQQAGECNIFDCPISILVFSEVAHSSQADNIAGIVNTVLHRRSFEQGSVKFNIWTSRLVEAIR